MRVDCPVVIHIGEFNLPVKFGELILLEIAEPSGLSLTGGAKHADKHFIFGLGTIGSTQWQRDGSVGCIDVDDVAQDPAQRLLKFNLTGRRLTVSTSLFGCTVHQRRVLGIRLGVVNVHGVGGHRHSYGRIRRTSRPLNNHGHTQLVHKFCPVIEIKIHAINELVGDCLEVI